MCYAATGFTAHKAAAVAAAAAGGAAAVGEQV
jgi:hypothetical protein